MAVVDPSGDAADPGPLPAGIRERLTELLAAELADAWRGALAAGTDPIELARHVDERRRAIEATPVTDDQDDCG
ncbi:hypothetical protein ACN27F_16005 [Solwaraspora sp. WMMB335]|uniref:hypothetical protein n=1 Tax=Solwaraspora sp. WMMB335 TaxID=3404118 RepID=UPI003B9494D7